MRMLLTILLAVALLIPASVAAQTPGTGEEAAEGIDADEADDEGYDHCE